MNIKVHIERLILDSLPVASDQSDSVQTAVKGELERLLASGLFAPASSFAGARIAAAEIHIHPGTTASDLGVEIGRKVFRSLAQSDLACSSSQGAVRGVVSTDRLVGVDLDDSNNDSAQKPKSMEGRTSNLERVRFSGPTQTNNQRR